MAADAQIGVDLFDGRGTFTPFGRNLTDESFVEAIVGMPFDRATPGNPLQTDRAGVVRADLAGVNAARFKATLVDKSGAAVDVEVSLSAFPTRSRTLALFVARPRSLVEAVNRGARIRCRRHSCRDDA